MILRNYVSRRSIVNGAADKGVWQWMALLSVVCFNGWCCCQVCVTMDGSAVNSV